MQLSYTRSCNSSRATWWTRTARRKGGARSPAAAAGSLMLMMTGRMSAAFAWRPAPRWSFQIATMPCASTVTETGIAPLLLLLIHLRWGVLFKKHGIWARIIINYLRSMISEPGSLSIRPHVIRHHKKLPSVWTAWRWYGWIWGIRFELVA